jgi:C1A family cysteine protease
MTCPRSIIALITLAFMLGMVVSSASAQTPVQAPYVPQDEKDSAPGRGFVPMPMDLPHLTGEREPDALRVVQAPSSWDWRESGKVTSVKDQGACGSCYSFASLANIESKMLLDGEGTFDFSENNAKECNWYGTACDGGNYWTMADWYSKQGTVLEACDPYVASDVSCKSTCPYIKTLVDWRVISSDNVPATAVLQDYIYAYGPVYTTLYAGDGSSQAWCDEFEGYNGSYTLYYDGTEATNHAVLIVGWDDALVHAGGTGAWIVKNSWGTGWGGTCGYGTEGGYFTIAYGSALIGQYSSYIYSWQDYEENEQLMYYDDGGYTSSWGYSNVTVWGLCEFTPTNDIYVNQVEFWTNDVTTDIDVYIYDDFNGVSLSNLLTSQPNSSFDEAGYHSVALATPPEIASGNAIYAVIKFTNATYGFPLVTDNQTPIVTGKTYMSFNGSSGTWIDMGADHANDIAIRIRTSPSLIVAADDIHESSPNDFSLSHNYPNPFNPSTTIEYELGKESHVDISIFNLLGQKVNTVVDEVKSSGEHSTRWDGTDYDGKQLPCGVYFYRIESRGYTDSKKMLLLR